MKQIHIHLLSPAIIILTVILLFSEAAAVETCKEWTAKVVSVQGNVQSQRTGEMQWEPVKFNNTYCAGDIIRVQERSRTAIVMSNETIIRLDQNTTITFTGVDEKQVSLIEVLNGVVHFFSRTPRTLKIITPFVNAAVEGTEFLINVGEDRTVVTVFEGQINATNNAGSLTLTSGQSAIAEEGKAPAFRVVVRPRDAVQWALYYPSIMHYRTVDFSEAAKSDWHAMVKKSIQFYSKGDLIKAFSSIEELPEELRDSRFYNYHAMLLLSVGRVDEAREDIERSLNLAPENSHALSLQSIIAVVQNDKDGALNFARKAVEAAPDSAAARIALSFAQQANFELEEALTSLQKAVELDPENSLAWARLAELWLSFGNLDKALEAAKKAVELSPDLSRTQTVLGFAYLTRIKTQASMKAFEKAINLDQGDPLPRLGLGLSKIREGKLEEGRREIEIAMSLNPGNSLIRSYLGKAYFEEKRDKSASEQFSSAKEFDPFDPTPFFYEAIQKQSLNRPVEALHDLQKSIELNDNRAVYRSRQLLDEDIAARSASLARIYNNLGFQQLALVEGWKSINTDPGSYSTHRFLADSYSALPRHEIAKVSELLQSQLLQPINITPVQPKLAESNLFILNGVGPGELSFNEFNPLFNRNRISLQISNIIGEQDTIGDELVFSGVQDKVSFSLGQFHFETDGFRENNDQEQDIYNIFTQVRLSHKTSIMAEFRDKELVNGDLTLNFDPDDFLPVKRETEESRSIRLGFRHSFTPNSDIIATLVYRDFNTTLHDVTEIAVMVPPPSPGPPMIIIVPADFDISTDDYGYMTEVQHLFSSIRFNVISGAGHLTADQKEIVKIDSATSEVNETDLEHTNIYVYSQINYPKKMTWTIGGSADFFHGLFVDRDQFNPKLGFTFNPLTDTTIRAAVFRVLKKTLISDQTLEPTQVAGFNQFFDDGEGTKSWRYGFAVDQKFSSDIYGGIEYSKRDLEVPFEDIPTSPTASPEIKEADWEEQLGRAYFYWTPQPWLALSAEYNYERFDRDKEFVAGIEQVETHSFPFGMNFYHPSGFSARLNTTYRDQEGSFQPQDVEDPSIFFSGSDQFWIVDFSIGYRLPKRFGLVTFGARNLFDKSFSFQDTDPVSPAIQPERMIFGKYTLAL
jgi:tetratricopeptide (TPR) repeat protein